MKPAQRLQGVELSLIRQINALATPLSTNLGIGEPNVEPDQTLRDFARRAAATASWHYTPNAGSPALRKLLAGSTWDPKSEICVTAGTQEGLFAIFQAFVDPGDEVLVPNPGFVSYATLARLCGAAPVTYDIEPPEWRRVERGMARARARAVPHAARSRALRHRARAGGQARAACRRVLRLRAGADLRHALSLPRAGHRRRGAGHPRHRFRISR